MLRWEEHFLAADKNVPTKTTHGIKDVPSWNCGQEAYKSMVNWWFCFYYSSNFLVIRPVVMKQCISEMIRVINWLIDWLIGFNIFAIFYNLLNHFKQINYKDDNVTKNRNAIPLDLDFRLGPYTFNLQATINHHGYSTYCGHHILLLSIVVKNILLQWCDISNKHNSWTAYMILYKLIMEVSLTRYWRVGVNQHFLIL